MASISTDKSGNRRVVFSFDGQRRTLFIGGTTMKSAETIQAKIEEILEAKLSRRSLAPEVAKWLGEIPNALAGKLAALGLVTPREKRPEDATKLGEFIDAYLVSRTDIKPRTRINLLQVRKNLVTHFGETKGLCKFYFRELWELILSV